MKSEKYEVENKYYEILEYELLNREDLKDKKTELLSNFLQQKSVNSNNIKFYKFLLKLSIGMSFLYFLTTFALNITEEGCLLSVATFLCSVILYFVVKTLFFESKKRDLLSFYEDKYNRYILITKSQEMEFNKVMSSAMKIRMQNEKERKGVISLKFIKSLIQ